MTRDIVVSMVQYNYAGPYRILHLQVLKDVLRKGNWSKYSGEEVVEMIKNVNSSRYGEWTIKVRGEWVTVK